MVDAEDLKSFGHCDRVGSSPTIPTTNFCYRARRARLKKFSATAEFAAQTKTGKIFG